MADHYLEFESKVEFQQISADIKNTREEVTFSPNSRKITPQTTKMGIGSTSLGMDWDPTLSIDEYPLKISRRNLNVRIFLSDDSLHLNEYNQNRF